MTNATAADSSYQFFTKLYTEGLGRSPNYQAWNSFQALLSANHCTDVVQNVAQTVLEGSEFNGDYGNDYNASVYAVYRALLNRDPGITEFNNSVESLVEGESFPSFIVGLLSGSEFQGLLASICGPPVSGQSGSYGWKSEGQYFPRAAGAKYTAAQINAMLTTASKGNKLVALPPQSIVLAEANITIPAGVTLMTAGGPGPTAYAEMARIVRSFVPPSGSSNIGELVTVSSGSTLSNIWVDGARSDFLAKGSLDNCLDARTPPNAQNPTLECINIAIRNNGVATSSVIYDKITDSSGWTNLVAYGLNNGYACDDTSIFDDMIEYNLDTQYATSHYAASNSQYSSSNPWSDGLSIECSSSLVEYNNVIDATDVGIVLFGNILSPAGGPPFPDPQFSVIAYNTIIAAGNAAFGLTGADPHGGQSPQSASAMCDSNGNPVNGYSISYDAAQISYNYLWTSPSSYVQFGIYLGVQGFDTYTNTGRDITVVGNQSYGIPVQVSIGIAITGMCNATLMNNPISFIVGNHGSCPQASELAVVNYSESPSVEPNSGPIAGCAGADHL